MAATASAIDCGKFGRRRVLDCRVDRNDNEMA